MHKPTSDVARACSHETATGGLALLEREVREDTKRFYARGLHGPDIPHASDADGHDGIGD